MQKSTSDGSVLVPEGLSVTRKKKKSKKDTRKSKGKPKDSHRKRSRIENEDEQPPSKRQMLPPRLPTDPNDIESSPPTPYRENLEVMPSPLLSDDSATTTSSGIPVIRIRRRVEAVPEHNREVFKLANILIGVEVLANQPWVVNPGLVILIQHTWAKARDQVLQESRLYKSQLLSRDIQPDKEPDDVSLYLV